MFRKRGLLRLITILTVACVTGRLPPGGGSGGGRGRADIDIYGFSDLVWGSSLRQSSLDEMSRER